MKKPGPLTPREVDQLEQGLEPEQELPAARPPLPPESFTDRWESLTNREKQVVQCKCQNKSSAEIADALFISEHTVKNTLTAVYRKLGVERKFDSLGKNSGAAAGFVCWQLGVITGIRIGRDGTVEPMAKPKPKRRKPRYSVEH